MESCDQLTRLSLESNLIGNRGLIGISKALVENETLEELYLYNNDFDDDAMPDFANMLKNKNKLVNLGLEYNKIRSKGLKDVLKAVEKLPNFERLLLNQNILDERSADPIYELLVASDSLRELRLSGNEMLGDECGSKIALGLLKSQSIKVCHLS